MENKLNTEEMMHMAGEGREPMSGRVEVSIPFQMERCPVSQYKDNSLSTFSLRIWSCIWSNTYNGWEKACVGWQEEGPNNYPEAL